MYFAASFTNFLNTMGEMPLKHEVCSVHCTCMYIMFNHIHSTCMHVQTCSELQSQFLRSHLNVFTELFLQSVQGTANIRDTLTLCAVLCSLTSVMFFIVGLGSTMGTGQTGLPSLSLQRLPMNDISSWKHIHKVDSQRLRIHTHVHVCVQAQRT